MTDAGLAPESIAEAERELRDLDRLLPRPTIGQFCSCMNGRAQRIIDRDLQLRRYGYLTNALMVQYRTEARRLRKREAELTEQLEEARLELRRRNAAIRGLLHVPPPKPGGQRASVETPAEQQGDTPKRRGAPKGHRGATRPRPGSIDATETLPCPGTCPTCGGDVVANGESDEILLEEIVPAIRYVIQQLLGRGTCSRCGEEVRHPAAAGPPIRTGPNLGALLSAMRQTMGVTFGKLARFSTETLGIPLTPAGALGIVNRTADRITPIADALRHSLRDRSWLHVDETGWRMDGQRWQMWGYFDDAIAVYQPDPSRSAQVVKDTLGEDFAGVVAADFYAAYDFLPRTQRCLIHLIRDVRKELEVLPTDRYLKGLEKRIGKLIRIARKMVAGELSERQHEQQAEQARKLLDAMLAARPPNKKPCQTLAKRLQRYRDSLLTFLEVPGLDCHNNRAERQLRPVVLFRKVSFGNRTDEGARRYGATATVVETARRQGKSPVDFLRQAIDPCADLPALARQLLGQT